MPGRLALAGFILALAVLVVVGVAGKGEASPPARSGDEWPSLPATPLASLPWARAWAATPEPSPAAACTTPRIEPLAAPIARHPRDLAPTGLETIGPTVGGVDALVADRDGDLWGMGAGRFLRFDGRGELLRTWAFDDDPTLAATSILAPAREGGVWLGGTSRIAWFDGDRFRDVISTPGAVNDLAEGPDGSLWVTVAGMGLYHWDGHLWLPVCGSPRDADVLHVAVGPDGDAWVSFGWAGGSASSGPARYDGRRWTVTSGDIPVADAALLAGADGTLWAMGNDGQVARLEGDAWSPVEHRGVDLSWPSSAIVEPDGSLWVIGGSWSSGPGPDAISMQGASVVRFDGGRWTVFGPGDGLPVPNAFRPAVNTLASIRGTVFAGSADGLYRLGGGHWTRTWGPASGPSGPAWLSSIVAVSSGEAWASGDPSTGDGLWHLVDGRWTAVRITGRPPRAPSSTAPPTLAYAAGVLAVVDGRGLVVLRDGRWSTLADGTFQAVALAPDGGTVYALGTRGGDPAAPSIAVTFRSAGGRWHRSDVQVDRQAIAPFAIDRTDGWWFAVGCGWTPCHLDILRDGRTTEVTPLGQGAEAGVMALQAAPNGDVWAVLQPSSADAGPPLPVAARYRDGVWRVFGAADGFLGGWSARIVTASDGTVWLAGDGLWRYDGSAWTIVRQGWFADLAFAPDGSALALGPSGVIRLPVAVVRAAPLSDQAATWCADPGHWASVHEAALALGVDEAAIDARTVAIVTARGRTADPDAFRQVRRLDGEFVRACAAAFAAGS